MRRSKYTIGFTFYVRGARIPSHVLLSGRRIQIWINSIEFYRVVKKAIVKFKADIQKNALLQKNFVKAWDSIERSVRNLDKEKKNSSARLEADFLKKEFKKRQKLGKPFQIRLF